MGESKSLLQQIEEEAVDSKSDMAALLRKCLVLASRLQNNTLKKWAWCELNGYTNMKELPNYRKFQVQSIGDFCGYGGSSLTNAPIPLLNVPEEFREDVSRCWFLESVAELQALSMKTKEIAVCQNWSADLIAHMAGRFYRGMNMISARKVISLTKVTKVLETVRNRILDFVLALEENCPEAGEAIGSTKLDRKEIEQMVTNNIFKDVGNVALQCETVVQNNTVNVEKGNWILLENLLREVKIETERISELKDILDKDPPKSKTNLGSRLSAWIGTTCSKAASGLYSIPFETISGVLVGAICKYMGFA